MPVKSKDVRAMGPEDRAKLLVETRAELMHERGLSAMGGAVKNPGKIRDLRTSIARVLTIQREELLAAHKAAGTKALRQPRAGTRPPEDVARRVQAAKDAGPKKGGAKATKAPAKKAPAKAQAKKTTAKPRKGSGGEE